ncbi:hypothetical protein MNBD_NITROSPIRAE02-350 [hydrothermal vent metagenome]|uniref:Uncharacterized protein n=1 Tax=hydrothermal vent metagenome TaxID=652676 RepID=A0A3B1CYW2_9ZZZZ
MSVEKIIFLYKDHLVVCSREGAAYSEKTFPLTGELPSHKGYMLVLPDELVNLVSTDIRPVKSGNLKEMVRLYLSGIFPEGEFQNRFGFVNTSPVTAFVYLEDLSRLIEEYPDLFNSASIITTPSLIALLSEEGNFVLRTDSTTLLKNDNGFLHIAGDTEGYPTAGDLKEFNITGQERKQVLQWIDRIIAKGRTRDLNLSLTGQQEGWSLAAMKKDLIFLVAVYLVFVIALFLKTVPLKEDLKVYEKAINDIYSSMKIADNPDPYGMLLFRISQLKKQGAGSIEPLKILSAMSTSFNEDASVDDLNVNQELIRIKGTIKNLQSLEKASEDLSRILNVKFVIESAKVQEEGVNFIITARFKE